MYYNLEMFPRGGYEETRSTRDSISSDFSYKLMRLVRDGDISCREVLIDNYRNYLNNCGRAKEIKTILGAQTCSIINHDAVLQHLKNFFPESNIDFNGCFIFDKPVNPSIISYCAFLFNYKVLFNRGYSDEEILFNIITDELDEFTFSVRFFTALFPYAVKYNFLKESYNHTRYSGPYSEIIGIMNQDQRIELIKKAFNNDVKTLESIQKSCRYDEGFWKVEPFIQVAISQLK
jgi:hypothetical protein